MKQEAGSHESKLESVIRDVVDSEGLDNDSIEEQKRLKKQRK